VGFAVVEFKHCIEQVVGFEVLVSSIEKVAVFAVVVVIHPSNLWLIKEVLAEQASQLTRHKATN
jgi:hypothetical protein